MKQFFALALVAAAFVACEDSKPATEGTSTENAGTTTTTTTTTPSEKKIDTVKNAAGKDSVYVFKGYKADGTDSTVAAAQ